MPIVSLLSLLHFFFSPSLFLLHSCTPPASTVPRLISISYHTTLHMDSLNHESSLLLDPQHVPAVGVYSNFQGGLCVLNFNSLQFLNNKQFWDRLDLRIDREFMY
ncbi:hypothetical protein BDR26DRAFT_871243 [Obelidium mucronatum]|nr:hypothetical protein BDR26DRAFT_871243 [Obelidium mucronatum]